jgi:hypothetical protein
MAIRIFENGRIEVGGKVVKRRNPEDLLTIGAKPKLASGLEFALTLAGFEHKHDVHLQQFAKRDDEFIREALRDFEDAVRSAYVDAMKPAKAKAENIMADGRFTPEAKRNQAAEAIEPARAKWVKVASEHMAQLIGGLRDIENLLLLALLPDLDGMTPEVAEARARECREAVLSMTMEDRAGLLLELGSKAALEPLHALKSDPLKREAASADILAGAREAAIKAQDGGWLLKDWELQKRMVEEAAGRLATLEAATNYALQALGLDGYEGNAGQWTQLSHNALVKSDKVLV